MNASSVRLLVAISFHCSEKRKSDLFSVVRELCLCPCKTVDICIYTNSTETVLFDELKICFPQSSIDLFSCPDLSHPYDLTWRHKRLIYSRFMEANYDYTHFLYLEDDEQFRFGNLEYFLNYRGKLSKYGLIPGFARVEWSSQGHCLVNTDNIEKQDVSKKSHVIVGDVKFIHLDNPYMGMFLLDKELILEYVKTKSFHIEESKEVWPWEVRERAAMGLMFDR